MLIFYYFLVCCNNYFANHQYYTYGYWDNWKFNHSKSENHQNHQDYLKSNDVINLSIYKKNDDTNGEDVILRSHDVQFTIGNDTFQEVVCHNERLGGNDDVSKLIDLFLLFRISFKYIFFLFSGALNLLNKVKASFYFISGITFLLTD